MAFWGVEIKAGKPHTLQYDDEKGRLHVSQATLGDGSSKEKTVVVCNVGDKKPIYLCSLFPSTMETCPLNVEFEEYEEVTLSVIGPHSVHLSGYFFGESPDEDGDECDSDSCEDCGLEGESESGESFDYDSEDEEDDFSDDDIEMFPASPAPKSGVTIEEITDEDKSASENDLSKRPKKKNNDNSQRQIVLKNAASPVLESEDEDGFPVSGSAKGGLSSKEEAEEEKGTNGQLKRKKTKGDSGDTNSAKRKKDDSPKDGNQVAPKEDVKKQKKSKKKRLREKEAKMQEEASKSASQSEAANNQSQAKEKPQDAVAGSATEKNQMNEKEKKAKNKNKQQESVAAAVTDKKGLTNEGEKAEGKPSQVRTFPNGLVIEELGMGKPNGKRAAAGKKVTVRYIGKLQKNGQIFDSNIGKAPFKFRLGVGQVIKGWDVGVNGMRVGDKRRLTIPPAMGYGAKGAGRAIPPNAWLSFDVELVDAS